MWNFSLLVFSVILFISNENASANLLPLLDGSCGTQIFEGSPDSTTTVIGEFPWTALLMYERRNFSCAGTIISDRYILTAAHCVDPKATDIIGELKYVRIGEWNYENRTDCSNSDGGATPCDFSRADIPVKRVIIHEFYSSYSQGNDIALIKLAKEIEFSSYVKPICLPTTNELKNYDHTHSNLIATGWTKPQRIVHSSIKSKTAIKQVETDDCTKFYAGNNVTITSKQICTTTDVVNGCKVVNGGSIIARNASSYYHLVGILSYGACGIEEAPTIYTKVSEYVDWINSQINEILYESTIYGCNEVIV